MNNSFSQSSTEITRRSKFAKEPEEYWQMSLPLPLMGTKATLTFGPRQKLYSVVNNVIKEIPRVVNKIISRISQIVQPICSIDLVEKDDEYIVIAEVPGVKKEDVVPIIKNGILTINATKYDHFSLGSDIYHHRERAYGNFERTIELPENADLENSTNKFENGVFYVYFPKLVSSKPGLILRID